MEIPGAKRLEINTAAGQIIPMGYGQFSEKHIQQFNGDVVTLSTDDDVHLLLVETGSLKFDEEKDEPLHFRQKRLKLKEIYDVDLVSSDPQHDRFRRDIITHFVMKELSVYAKKIKNSIPEVNGDLGIQEIEDLAMKLMEECGQDGKLVFLKNSVIVTQDDVFELHLRTVYKKHKNSRMMCGALFCKQPSKVIKASYTGRVRLA